MFGDALRWSYPGFIVAYCRAVSTECERAIEQEIGLGIENASALSLRLMWKMS